MKKISLNRNQLKYIAAAAMLIDHIGMLFIPVSNPLGCLMRVIGRLTAPIMCMFLAEGYYYTSSKIKYGARLFVFAVLSQSAYAFAHGNSLLTPDFNMIFTLFLCFLILLANENIKNYALKAAVIFALTAVSYFCDWGVFAPLWVLTFYIFREDKKRKALLFSAIAGTEILSSVIFCVLNGYHWYGELWQTGLYLFIPVIFIYNGEGGSKNAFSRWFFYLFYPLHLVLLRIIFDVI